MFPLPSKKTSIGKYNLFDALLALEVSPAITLIDEFQTAVAQTWFEEFAKK
jgi:hypothetical protein